MGHLSNDDGIWDSHTSDLPLWCDTLAVDEQPYPFFPNVASGPMLVWGCGIVRRRTNCKKYYGRTKSNTQPRPTHYSSKHRHTLQLFVRKFFFQHGVPVVFRWGLSRSGSVVLLFTKEWHVITTTFPSKSRLDGSAIGNRHEDFVSTRPGNAVSRDDWYWIYCGRRGGQPEPTQSGGRTRHDWALGLGFLDLYFQVMPGTLDDDDTNNIEWRT